MAPGPDSEEPMQCVPVSMGDLESEHCFWVQSYIRVISHRMLNSGKYSLYAVSDLTLQAVSRIHIRFNVNPDPAFQGDSESDLGFAAT
jgi:hypothetical protein